MNDKTLIKELKEKNDKLEKEIEQLKNNNENKWLINEINKINTNYNDCRKDKFKKQLLEQGFYDGQTYNLNKNLVDLILPRLRRYKELAESKIKIDFPLDDMILCFELLDKYECDSFDIYNNKEDFEKINYGLKCFSKYFLALWW